MIPLLPPSLSFNSSSSLLPHSSILLKSKSMSFITGGAIRVHWAAENKDGPKVPGEGHPETGRILSFVLHTLLFWLVPSHR